jgi:hypothetical protein
MAFKFQKKGFLSTVQKNYIWFPEYFFKNYDMRASFKTPVLRLQGRVDVLRLNSAGRMPLAALERGVFRTPYDFFLERQAQVTEVIAVPGDPDYKAAMGFGASLGFAQCFSVYYVELNVMPVQLEISANQVGEAVNALVAFEQRGRELHIQQRTAGFDVIHFAGGFNDGGWAAAVSALHRAYSL